MKFLKITLSGLAFILILGAKASAQSNSCKAFITIAEHDNGAATVITAHAMSRQPIVAYVVTNTPLAVGDTRSYSLHGVFTDGDYLHPRQTMRLGTIPRRQVKGLLKVDYLRLSDGTTCGATVTQDARQIAARFQ